MIRCLNCKETFSGHEEYSRHKWNDHAGDPDHGEVYY